MKHTTECDELRQLHTEDYLCEDRVEPERSIGVQSISFTSSKVKTMAVNMPEACLIKYDRNNMNKAYKRVKANKRGSHGIDGMTVDELLQFLKGKREPNQADYPGGYLQAKTCAAVEIPKLGGGKRLLGIPTVVDRVVQQAVAQVLSPIFEKQFSELSYGFRPERDAETSGIEMQGIHRSRL